MSECAPGARVACAGDFVVLLEKDAAPGGILPGEDAAAVRKKDHAKVRNRRPPLVDAWIALGLLALALAEILAGVFDAPWTRTVPTALLFTVPLAWRRQVPGLAAILATSGITLRALLGVEASDGLSETIALVLAMYSLAFHSNLDRAMAVLGVCAVLVWIAVSASEGTGTSDYVFAGLLLLAPWVAGRVVLGVQQRAQAAEHRAEEAEREREAQAAAAVAEERQRIARELHDVIAHSITVMLMGTGATRRLLRPDQERERQELLTVEATGRHALAEMRRLVSMLREPEEPAALGPQPGLGQLDALAEETRRLGVRVDLDITGCTADLPPGIDLAAYRIIQESLTNVVKHARATCATVTVATDREGLAITVVDDGRGEPSPNSAGHGLVGMRQRAAIYGGSLEAAPLPGGGFRVHAYLPFETAHG